MQPMADPKNKQRVILKPVRMTRWRWAALALLLACAGLIAACATPAQAPAPHQPLGQASFADYQRETVAWIAAHRTFESTTEAGRQQEIAWNSPQEWLPRGPLRGGVLLAHGLGDSPWSFTDIGAQLAADGYLVRTVLLPGHGTRPADLLNARVADWQRVVDEQTAALQHDVREHAGEAAPVWLGGFSTGANLVVAQAYRNPGIAGLLLFSPAFKTASSSVWLTPLIASVRPWLVQADGTPGSRPAQNGVRYLTVPTNGFAQFYRSSQAALQEIGVGHYDKPVFMVVAQHDSVLDAPFLLDVFHRHFTHPASRLIWYGELPEGAAAHDARVTRWPDRLPARRISQFSHMGVLFSPANPVYGENGSRRFCWNGQSPEALRQCEQGAPVWYSDWGYQESGKVHARLTFNPYFTQQSTLMAQVMAAGASPAVAAPRAPQ